MADYRRDDDVCTRVAIRMCRSSIVVSCEAMLIGSSCLYRGFPHDDNDDDGGDEDVIKMKASAGEHHQVRCILQRCLHPMHKGEVEGSKQ